MSTALQGSERPDGPAGATSTPHAARWGSAAGSPYRLKDDPFSSHGIILGNLGEGRGRRLLDVGTADGYLAERLTAAGWEVTGLERDPTLAEAARQRCHRVLVVDLERETPVLPGDFHAAVFGDVLEHLSDPLKTLRALGSRVAPEATVVVSVPNIAHLWIRLGLLVGRFEYEDRGILDRTHLRHFTRRSLLAMLVEAGLEVRRLLTTPVPLPLVVPRRLHGRWLDTVHRASAAASRAWPGGLAYQFVAVCGRGRR